MPFSLDHFHSSNRFRAINRCCQLLLGLSLLGMLFWLAAHTSKRIDLTHQHRYTLAPETIAYIEKIDKPITLYVTLSAHSKDPALRSLYADLRGLLKEYLFAAEKTGDEKIKLEFIDAFSARPKIEALNARFQLLSDNMLILSQGERYEILRPMDFYKTEEGNMSAFIGEQVITSALLRLSQENRPKCYFSFGHGEYALKDVNPLRGLSQLDQFLQSRGIDTESLDIATRGIPKDIALLIIAGPRRPFLPEEEIAIKHYLESRSGRLIFLIAPDNPHGLDHLLEDWGLLADKAIVIDLSPSARLANGDLLLRRFAPHPITQSILDYQLTILTGLAGPVRPDPAAKNDPNRLIIPLIASSEQSWAERHFEEGRMETYEPLKGDLPGPICLACAVSKQVGKNLGINIQGGRLIAFGSCDWITNHRFGIIGNELLFWNTCQWLLNRQDLQSLSARTLGHYQFPLSPSQLLNLLYLLLIPSSLAAICGLGIFFIRRR